MIKTNEGEREHPKENNAVFRMRKRANVSKYNISLYKTVYGTNLV